MDEEKKILTKKCPHCGKEFFSLYENQLDYNFEAHILSCKKKNGEENE